MRKLAASRYVRNNPRVSLLASGAAILLAVSACSSSGSSGTASSGGDTGSAGASGSSSSTAAPYVIGQIGTFSGDYASSNAGAKYGLDAWVKYTNAHGGINGHQVQLISKDDQLDASLAQTEVKELVEQDHVLAIVGSSSIVEDNITSYISSGTTPFIGDDLAKDVMENPKNKNFFPEGTTQSIGYFYALPKVAAEQGQKKYAAIYCAESTACQQIADSQKSQAKAAGVDFVYSASAKATDTSYTAQCLAAKQAGATALALLLAAEVAGRVASDCAQQGYHPLYLQAANGFSNASKALTALNPDVGPVPVFPWFDDSTPARKAFQSAMKQYEPDAFNNSTNGWSGAAAAAWASGEIFKAAASKLTGGSPTGADLEQALYKLPKGDTFGGLTPPITYRDTGGAQAPVKCFFVIQLKNSKYSTLNGGRPVCKS